MLPTSRTPDLTLGLYTVGRLHQDDPQVLRIGETAQPLRCQAWLATEVALCLLQDDGGILENCLTNKC